MERLGKDTEIMNSIKTRELRYFGHLMRHHKGQLLFNIMQGKIEGKRTEEH